MRWVRCKRICCESNTSIEGSRNPVAKALAGETSIRSRQCRGFVVPGGEGIESGAGLWFSAGSERKGWKTGAAAKNMSSRLIMEFCQPQRAH